MRTILRRCSSWFRLSCASALLLTASAGPRVFALQTSGTLTPTQVEIEKQHQRLSSPVEEDRRDALMRLGSMHLAAASRVALAALADPVPVVRAVAAHAILSLGSEESANSLLPMLTDKDQFVRREVTYALGLTRSRGATAALSERLVSDKEDGVRGAAAIALGEIADEAAVVTLAGVLSQELPLQSKGNRKKKVEQNPFVLRACATALGLIRSRAGVPALINALANERLPNDVRREAAYALGLIGDQGAVPALRAASNGEDPYLALAAFQSLRRISH